MVRSLNHLHHHDRRNQRTGATLVEFAVVFPLILLFFGGTLEIARVLMLKHASDTAAYEAARVAMVPGATAADAIAEANLLLAANGLEETLTTVTPAVITEETAFVTVSVEVPVAPNSWVAPELFIDMTVKSEVTLLTERSPIVKLTGLPDLKLKKQKIKGAKGGKNAGV